MTFILSYEIIEETFVAEKAQINLWYCLQFLKLSQILKDVLSLQCISLNH